MDYIDNVNLELSANFFNAENDAYTKAVNQFRVLHRYGVNGRNYVDEVTTTYHRMLVRISGYIDDDHLWLDQDRGWHYNHLSHGEELILHGSKRRLHIDRRLAMALGSQVAKQKQANTTAVFLKSRDLYPPRCGSVLEKRYVEKMIGASWLAFQNVEHCSFCSDGVRCGMPQKERLLIPLYNIDSKVGTWLPPIDS